MQIRGFRVRLPLDVLIVASANPEDYTNRGRIITPLKDRYGAQIRTHYPEDLETELEIVRQEAADPAPSGVAVSCPRYMEEIVVEIARVARRSPFVSQRSGVSVRASIAAYETMLANAARRALEAGETSAAPRVCDLRYLAPAVHGKLELETVEEEIEHGIVDVLIETAVDRVFKRYFDLNELGPLIEAFETGLAVEVGEDIPVADYAGIVNKIDGAREALAPLDVGEDVASLASAVELLLEGLHRNKRLNKDTVGGRSFYRA